MGSLPLESVVDGLVSVLVGQESLLGVQGGQEGLVRQLVCGEDGQQGPEDVGDRLHRVVLLLRYRLLFLLYKYYCVLLLIMRTMQA